MGKYALGPDFAAWTVVPDTSFTSGGFNGTVSTSWENPLGGKRAWCHQLASWTPVSLDLLALVGQTVKLRWHEGDDASGSATGWYVDSVTIANTGTAAACFTASSAPPPVMESGENLVRFSIDHGDVQSVTCDATTCGAANVIVLHNSLGSWDGYSGCAQPLGGHSGSTTVDSTGQENVRYDLVWTDGGIAGHPGFASSGPRTWKAGALCGMSGDDHSRSTCP